MAIEVKCPYNENIYLLSVDENDSTFNISTPFSFSRIDDYSYAVVEHLEPTKEPETKTYYDENGNYLYSKVLKDKDGNIKYTGRTILSGVGYDYSFPYKKDSDFDLVGNFPETSIGWFNSFGSKPGSIGYSLGNTWNFSLKECTGLTSDFDFTQLVNKTSGRCGLNEEGELFYYRKLIAATNEANGCFVVRNNNAFFDYLLCGPGHDYLKMSRQRSRNTAIEDDYWIGMSDIYAGDYYYTLYGIAYENDEKTRQAKEFGGNWIPVYSSDFVLYTPMQFESTLGVDFNNPETLDGYYWGIYGKYKNNGRTLYFECNPSIQAKITEFLSGKKLKQQFSSFRDMLEQTIEYCGIILDNVRYASLALIVSPGETGYSSRKYVVGDSLLIPIYSNKSYLPNFLENLMLRDEFIYFSTPNAMSKPMFLMNGLGLMDFPCYKIYGDTIGEITKTNFSYDSSKNRTKFDIIVDGLFPDTLSIDCPMDNWTVVGKKTRYVIPPIFDRSADNDKNYENHLLDITTSAKVEYPVSTGEGKLTLSTSAQFLLDGTTFGNYDGILSLGSKYPMTPNASIRFATETIFTVEVEGDSVSHTFTVTAPELHQVKDIFVKYSRLNLKTSTVKLDNSKSVSLGKVVLQPYMYDATTIYVDCRLANNKVISFTDDDVSITLSDNTGAGKSVQDIKLKDILNGTYGDLIYSTGLMKNPISNMYEVTIYIAAYCDSGVFAGLGFNDSSVLVSFTVDEYTRQVNNIADYEYNASYMTVLPPYMIQGNPFTKNPEDESVLNSAVVPNNVSARVDYLYGSYQENSYDVNADALFSNGKPTYYCVASAFVPGEFNGTISDINCHLSDAWENGRKTEISFTSADDGISEFVVLTSSNIVNDSIEEAKTNLRVYSFEQRLDVESARMNMDTVSSILEISAHIDYSITDGKNMTNSMVTISSV